MTNLAVKTVTSLPGVVDSSTLYFVRSAESPFMDIYLTNLDGSEARHVISKTEIQSMISAGLAGLNNIVVVNNIAARDALTPSTNVMVLVLDASADSTVTTGSALYVYRFSDTSWNKVSEFESMDVDLLWANIQNKPTSTVGDIDDAVSKKHAHANSAVLALLGQDGNGQLTYNGINIGLVLATADW